MMGIWELVLTVMGWGMLVLMVIGFLILAFAILVGFYRGIRKVLAKKPAEPTSIIRSHGGHNE